jgi:hypothetical protein
MPEAENKPNTEKLHFTYRKNTIPAFGDFQSRKTAKYIVMTSVGLGTKRDAGEDRQ